jgi:hypothetical protein
MSETPTAPVPDPPAAGPNLAWALLPEIDGTPGPCPGCRAAFVRTLAKSGAIEWACRSNLAEIDGQIEFARSVDCLKGENANLNWALEAQATMADAYRRAEVRWILCPQCAHLMAVCLGVDPRPSGHCRHCDATTDGAGVVTVDPVEIHGDLLATLAGLRMLMDKAAGEVAAAREAIADDNTEVARLRGILAHVAAVQVRETAAGAAIDGDELFDLADLLAEFAPPEATP